MEWGDSNFQIFSQNCQFHHRQLESLEHFYVLFILYHSEHYGLIFDLKDFCKCMCVMCLTPFDGFF